VTRISNLFRLQNLDSQIDSHRSRLAEVERNLAEHPELDQALATESAAHDELESARQTLRKADEETKRQQQRIAETDKTLYGGSVRNPKELQDLQEEAASLRRFLSVLEERQLQAMIQCEERENAFLAAQSKRGELEQKRAEEEKQLLEGKASIQSALATLGVQREAVLTAVSAEDLEKYNALRSSKHGVAVARLEGGSCTGCGVAPSATRIDSARSGQEIIQCGNCGRILYLG
jgi:predicted  nucleic acid-binding Zn-ribbon protein